VGRAYLDRAFSTMDQTYGSVQSYLADGLGIPADQQEELRARFLTPPAAS
jgi:protein tyrosine/serine phosphatase